MAIITDQQLQQLEDRIQIMTDTLTRAQAEGTAAIERARTLESQKNVAYAERDRLVCALSKLFPSHLQRHPESDTTWDNDWRWIVCIHAPTGPMTWHIHDSEFEWFKHLRIMRQHWDGHTTDEKYGRLEKMPILTVPWPDNCPTCTSPAPRLHPAMQFEGEVQPCKDQWHDVLNA